MSRHFRRFCFYLADKLKMPVRRLLNEVDAHEIAEWMAYEKTINKDWLEKYQHDLELEQSKQMTAKEQADAFKRLLRGK